jgi:hypothetical protein
MSLSKVRFEIQNNDSLKSSRKSTKLLNIN